MTVSELRALYEKATQGEWKAQHSHNGECVFDKDGNVVCYPWGYPDAAFIAASHNAMPELLDTIDALQKRLGKAEQVIKDVREWCVITADSQQSHRTTIWNLNKLLGDYASDEVVD